MAVHRCFPSSLTELERICREKRDKLSKSRCARLVETNPRRITAVNAVKGASTKS
ncbi:hypothetical protein LDENG_00244110 [Lucifuga dentata]|nr:hypothetical protein LDENG_00244110 [Lucifuga dentata]